MTDMRLSDANGETHNQGGPAAETHDLRPTLTEWFAALDALPRVRPTRTGAEAVRAARDKRP